MALDYLATVRTIWQGHLSNQASKAILRKDPGMQAMHLWLHSLTRMPLYPRLKIKEEQKIGDKPAVEVAEPAVEAGLMMLYKAFKSS